MDTDAPRSGPPDQPPFAHLVQEPGGHAAPLAPPRRGRSSAALALGLMAVLAVIVGGVLLVGFAAVAAMGLGSDDQPEEHYHSLARHGGDKVAIITVEGTILDGDGFAKKQIDRVRDDKHVKAVVLRVNSPGGTVTGSDYLYHHLTKLAKEREIPIVVSMGGIAASGGYYVAMAVGDEPDTIFAEPTTWTGSIGVVIPHYNVAGLMQKWEVEEDSIKSHPLKQMGSPTKKMTPEERAIFQALVDDSFSRFKQIVRAGRPKLRDDPKTLDRVATGQVFTTHDALAAGLVDREGFIEDAIDRAIELAGLDKDHTKVVKYKRHAGLFDFGISAHAGSRGPDLALLLDMATPRAYYLCTWLPVMNAEE
jgi:protease IV